VRCTRAWLRSPPVPDVYHSRACRRRRREAAVLALPEPASLRDRRARRRRGHRTRAHPLGGRHGAARVGGSAHQAWACGCRPRRRAGQENVSRAAPYALLHYHRPWALALTSGLRPSSLQFATTSSPLVMQTSLPRGTLRHVLRPPTTTPSVARSRRRTVVTLGALRSLQDCGRIHSRPRDKWCVAVVQDVG
jgi:hypothetical protein